MTDLEKYLEERYEEIDARYCEAALSVKRIHEKYTALRDAALKAETGAELYGNEYEVCAEYWDALIELAHDGDSD